MRLPVLTDIGTRDGTLSKDEKCVNAIGEISGEDVHVFKRPGLVQQYSLGAATGQCLFVLQTPTTSAAAGSQVLCSIAGDTLTYGVT